MSGHSKWNNIKNRKGAVDAKRGKAFGQISKLIRIAVRDSGSGDPKTNPSLRVVLEKARAANMPKGNIQRAIDKGLGKSKGGQLQEIVYEGFGPGGVGFLVEVVTDNPNRVGSELKNVFSKNNGSLGSPGSAKYLFDRIQGGEGYVTTMPIPIADDQVINKLENLIDSLRDNEDVEQVHSNGEWEGKS